MDADRRERWLDRAFVGGLPRLSRRRGSTKQLMFTWPWQKKTPPEPEFNDRVWQTLAARDQALVRAAQARPLVVIAFFDETIERVRAALKQAGLAESPSLVVARVDQLEHRPAAAQSAPVRR